jgi:hypothetical protein
MGEGGEEEGHRQTIGILCIMDVLNGSEMGAYAHAFGVRAACWFQLFAQYHAALDALMCDCCLSI